MNAILKRHRSGIQWFNPRYDMFFFEDMHFIMSSKRKSCHLTSNYHMGVKKEPVDEGDDKYVGTVKGNYSGSVWNLYDKNEGE